MRPDRFVMATPGLDDDACLLAASGPLQAQAFVAESAIEGFLGTVLPRLSRIDRGGLDAFGLDQLEDGATDEFWPILGPAVARRSAHADQLRQDFDDLLGTQASN